MDKMKPILLSSCFIIILLGMIALTLQHEQAHKEFYAFYGVNSDIHLTWFGILGGYTEPDINDYNKLSVEDLRTVNMLHAINEIYWYPFATNYVIFSGFFILCVSFFIKTMEQTKAIQESNMVNKVLEDG